MTQKRERAGADFADSPTVWFAALQLALRIGDQDGELRARTELARLGVLVNVDRDVLMATTGGETA